MTEQGRRYVCRLIDLAVEHCEEGNLREQLEIPRWIADLVVQLQAAAGEELVVPPDTIAAHGQLLDLRGRYLPIWRRSVRSPARLSPRPSNNCSTKQPAVKLGGSNEAASWEKAPWL